MNETIGMDSNIFYFDFIWNRSSKGVTIVCFAVENSYKLVSDPTCIFICVNDSIPKLISIDPDFRRQFPPIKKILALTFDQQVQLPPEKRYFSVKQRQWNESKYKDVFHESSANSDKIILSPDRLSLLIDLSNVRWKMGHFYQFVLDQGKFWNSWK